MLLNFSVQMGTGVSNMAWSAGITLKHCLSFLFKAEADRTAELSKRLQDQLDAEHSESQKLSEKLQQLQRLVNEKSDAYDGLKSELDDQVDKLKLEVRDKNLELDQSRDKLARLEIELENRSDELLNLSREIESLRKCLNESERKVADSEKETLSIKDRERAQKELNQQMITYHKDLQEQIRSFSIFFHALDKKVIFDLRAAKATLLVNHCIMLSLSEC